MQFHVVHDSDESCVEVKIEADSEDTTECSHDDKPSIGMFGFLRLRLPL